MEIGVCGMKGRCRGIHRSRECGVQECWKREKDRGV